jgi:hypothetical protein
LTGAASVLTGGAWRAWTWLQAVFKMAKPDFYALPKWKQQKLKKDNNLF